MFKNQVTIKDFDIKGFPFYKQFSGHCKTHLGGGDLTKLHEFSSDNLQPESLLTVEGDQDVPIYKILYQIDPSYSLSASASEGLFIQTYRKFVQMLAVQVFKEDLVYQRLPTLRVHFPNNLSVGGYHRDRDYNHPNEEINIWVPLTLAYKTASIHIELSIGEKHHQPVNIDFGQYAIFDSALEHGNEVNVEGYTRMSFDFRVIPCSQYKQSNMDSVRQNIPFQVGEYYDLMQKSEI